MNIDQRNKLDAIQKHEDEMMEKHGWIVHYVFGENEEELVDIHTHGVNESFDHMDFQIVVPIPQRVAHIIFSNLVARVKNGELFEPEKRYGDIIKNFDVFFIKTSEGERDILRLIFPDPQGNFPEDTDCESFYRKQLL